MTAPLTGWARLELRGEQDVISQAALAAMQQRSGLSLPEPILELLRTCGTGRLFGMFEVPSIGSPLWTDWQAGAQALRAGGFWCGIPARVWADLVVYAVDDAGYALALSTTTGRRFFILTPDGAVVSLGTSVDELLDQLPSWAARTYDVPVGSEIDIGIEPCFVRGEPITAWLEALADGDDARADDLLPQVLGSEPLLVAYTHVVQAVCSERGDRIEPARRNEVIATVLRIALRREPLLAELVFPPPDALRTWATQPSRFDARPAGLRADVPRLATVEPVPEPLRPALAMPFVEDDATLQRFRKAWTADHERSGAELFFAQCQEVEPGLRYAIVRQILHLEWPRSFPGHDVADTWRAEAPRVIGRLKSAGEIARPFIVLGLRAVQADAARQLLPVLEGYAPPALEPLLRSLVERPNFEQSRTGGSYVAEDQYGRAYVASFVPSDEVIAHLLSGIARHGRGMLPAGPVVVLARRIDDDRVYEAFLERFVQRADVIAPALVNRPGPRTIAVLKQQLRAEELADRSLAAEALVALGDPAGPPALERCHRAWEQE